MGGVCRDHREGFSADLKEVLANRHTALEREPDDLRDVLEKFTVECEMAGMRRNISKSEAMGFLGFFLPICLLWARREGGRGVCCPKQGVQIS